MLSLTTGQFVLCITDGHLEIEVNSISDCEQACDNPIEEQNEGSTDTTQSCSHCTDTIITLDNIIKSKDDINRCCKFIISNLINIQTIEITDTKITSSSFYLHNYKNLILSFNQYIIDTSVLLI